MKKTLILSAIFMLTGCPGGADRLDLGELRGINIISPERVCYSVNKQDILSTYYLETNEQRQPVILLSSGRGAHLNLSYPATCFPIQLKTGNQYFAFYTLNGVKYYDKFIIDNNWNVVGL